MEANKGAKWQVVGQNESTEMGPSGTFVTGYRVTFRLEDGTLGNVFVPRAGYSAQTVMAAIAPHAEELAAVAQLKRGM